MNVAVCIATYKRPSLLQALLRSLERLAFVNVEQPGISIVVIDNDRRGSAARVISDFPSYRHKLLYRVETTPGISYARNAGIKAATTSDFVAFLDDDEEASPQWLEELLTVQHAFQSSIVAGPIVPTYTTPPPAWVRAGRFHQRKRYSTGTRVTSTSAGNCLISREVLCATEPCWFDPKFALTGGEGHPLLPSLLPPGVSGHLGRRRACLRTRSRRTLRARLPRYPRPKRGQSLDAHGPSARAWESTTSTACRRWNRARGARMRLHRDCADALPFAEAPWTAALG